MLNSFAVLEKKTLWMHQIGGIDFYNIANRVVPIRPTADKNKLGKYERKKKTCLHLHCTPHARNSFLALSLPLCHSAFSLDALSFVPLYIHLYGDLSLTWRWEKMDGWSLSIAYLCISMLDCRIRSRSVICYYCY